MEKSKMHTVAGILTVIAAVLKLFAFFGLIIAIFAVEGNPMIYSMLRESGVFMDIPTLLMIIAVPMAVFGIMGGVGASTHCRGKNGRWHSPAQSRPRCPSRYWELPPLWSLS